MATSVLSTRKTSVLYLTRNGLLEPLGQSQVVSYLRGLAASHRITVISYEKDADWADEDRVAALRAECEHLGIIWLPQRFLPRPKIVAPALSMLRMIFLAAWVAKRDDVKLIHARSYIPAAVAWCVSRITGIGFIFDMRALWPEELIAAGRLSRGSLLHDAMIMVERVCLRDAAAVVSLTHAAVDHLRQIYPAELTGQRVAVIPTCADLDRFVEERHRPRRHVLGCLGTLVSGWFRLDWLARFFLIAARDDPALRFEITTRDDADVIRKALGEKILLDRLSIAPSPSERVHEIIQGQRASVMFFSQGLGKLGSSPTRMGEILGCGVPVVANDGVGDVAGIIRRYRVGVLVRDGEEESMAAAWHELKVLLDDPELSTRCRLAAEEIFSLSSGTRTYEALYKDILQGF